MCRFKPFVVCMRDRRHLFGDEVLDILFGLAEVESDTVHPFNLKLPMQPLGCGEGSVPHEKIFDCPLSLCEISFSNQSVDLFLARSGAGREQENGQGQGDKKTDGNRSMGAHIISSSGKQKEKKSGGCNRYAQYRALVQNVQGCDPTR